ncbi:GNAT family N-acetyltransferase [Candidatus Gottesmanbacteria bacterium]|nr:GNAT family N-acetyltransferase [Candidatus Gottesmanbacteria bacterium]
MIIRRAEEKDIPMITKLGEGLTSLHLEFDPDYYVYDREGFSASFSQWLRTQIPLLTSLLLVAEENGNIVGFMSGFIKYLFPWYSIKRVGHISFTFIDGNFRGRGIGSKLLAEAIAWFKSQNLSYVELYANEKNSPGLSFWKSHGFDDFQKFLRKRI